MAPEEGDSGNDLASSFPHPPAYYKYFTKENVARVKELETRGETVPSELQLLVPPPAPTTTYLSFGNIWQVHDKLPSLEEMGINRLYKGDDRDDDGESSGGMTRIEELRKLFKSLLVKYLELVGVMGVDPEKFPPLVDEIRILLINIHHLLNEYRPHQARQSLIIMMEDRLQSIKDSIDVSSKTCTHVVSRLTEIVNLMDQIQTYNSSESLVDDRQETRTHQQDSSNTSRLNGALLRPVTMRQLEERDMESWNLLRQAGLV